MTHQFKITIICHLVYFIRLKRVNLSFGLTVINVRVLDLMKLCTFNFFKLVAKTFSFKINIMGSFCYRISLLFFISHEV